MDSEKEEQEVTYLMNRNVTAASLWEAETCVESGDPAS